MLSLKIRFNQVRLAFFQSLLLKGAYGACYPSRIYVYVCVMTVKQNVFALFKPLLCRH